MKKLLAIIIVFVVTVSSLPAIAVYDVDINNDGIGIITLKTKKADSEAALEFITLKQEKSRCILNDYGLYLKDITKEGNIYSSYNITVKNNTSGEVKEISWSGKAVKINLDSDSEYTIKVSYDEHESWVRSGCKLNSYIDAPYWYISDVSNVASYY